MSSAVSSQRVRAVLNGQNIKAMKVFMSDGSEEIWHDGQRYEWSRSRRYRSRLVKWQEKAA